MQRLQLELPKTLWKRFIMQKQSIFDKAKRKRLQKFLQKPDALI